MKHIANGKTLQLFMFEVIYLMCHHTVQVAKEKKRISSFFVSRCDRAL